MKILTLNINSIRAHAQSFIDLLKRGEYDTIMVQELKVENANFPHMLFDEFGYNIKVFGQKSWNGVATFSKYSIEDVTCGLPTYPDVNDIVAISNDSTAAGFKSGLILPSFLVIS